MWWGLFGVHRPDRRVGSHRLDRFHRLDRHNGYDGHYRLYGYDWYNGCYRYDWLHRINGYDGFHGYDGYHRHYRSHRLDRHNGYDGHYRLYGYDGFHRHYRFHWCDWHHGFHGYDWYNGYDRIHGTNGCTGSGLRWEGDGGQFPPGGGECPTVCCRDDRQWLRPDGAAEYCNDDGQYRRVQHRGGRLYVPVGEFGAISGFHGWLCGSERYIEP